MNKLNKFIISGTIVGITSTTRKTILNVATMSHDRKDDTTFLLIRFERTVDVCGYNVKDNVTIEGYFSKGLLYGTEISYLPRPLDKYKELIGEDISYKSTYIQNRKNEILVSGIAKEVKQVEGTPFSYVTIKVDKEDTIRVSFVGKPKDIEFGSEVVILGYLQSYESQKNGYTFVSLNAIDYQVFGKIELKEEPKEIIEKTEEPETVIPNPFDLP